MNINNIMPQLFLQRSRNKNAFSNPLDKMSPQYRNRYADSNEVKLNSQGIAGMCIHGKDPSEYQQFIDISDEGSQKLFDMVKSEFIKNNGVLQGDTTKKTEVFSDYLRGIPEGDRLKAAWTLDQMGYQYRSEFVSAIKQSNPRWNLGEPFDSSVLQGITKDNIGAAAVDQSGRGLDVRV